VFALYLACDGNVGDMVATETATKTQLHSMADDLEWCTRTQILPMHNNSEAVADAIIAHCTKVGFKRRHPSAPTVDELVQYKCTVKSTESRRQTVEHVRSLHWTGVVPGPTAVAMAENIERIMAMSYDETEAVAAADAESAAAAADEPPQKKLKGKGKAKAGPKPKPKPKPQQELRRTYTAALAAMCLEWVTIMSDVKARLSHQTWASGLCMMLEKEIKGFQQLHETIFKSLEPSVEKVTELQKLYRDQVESSRQCTLAGDNMLGSRRKKFPSEPKCPCDASGSDDAAGGEAGAVATVGGQPAR